MAFREEIGLKLCQVCQALARRSPSHVSAVPSARWARLGLEARAAVAVCVCVAAFKCADAG
jgi:hypothetical protein